MKTILILGGGVGGVVTANVLRKKIGKEHKIIVIDKEREHVFAPSLLWLMVGLRKPEKISRELSRLQRKGIEFVNGEIENVNPSEKSVVVNGKTYTGDYMVISLGTELVKPPELKAAGYNFYCLKGAQLFWEALQDFKGGKVVVLISSIPFKCPAAPYEAALLLAYYFKKKKLRDNVELELYSPEPGPMGVAGKELSASVRALVESKGIKYFPEHHYSNISGNTLEFSNGTKTDFDLLAYVPTHQCPKVIRETGLVGESGWVKLKNRETMETDFQGVFAIGDSTSIPLAVGKPLPKAGVFAHYQAEVVANNIAVTVNGKGKLKTFTGHGECFIELGEGKAGLARGNFYAEPLPKIKMYKPGIHWHAGKVLFEKDFLRRWF
ncbi:NAD(P)/FAD-dependent oxidoreductase [Bacteroidales bacterium AH-315-I05]|nr:NAD(P)/FAD-dependent oxidoreductase [Bacteroidales bacterium AH-315-I05]